MREVFRKAIEQIVFGGDVSMIVYRHYKETFLDVGLYPKRSPEVKFEEFIQFCLSGGITQRKSYFIFTKKEYQQFEDMKGKDIEIFREDFNWAKANLSEEDHKKRIVDAESAGISDTMLGGDGDKLSIARAIMNNIAYKWKSDKIKALLKEQFTDAEVHQIMNQREDMVCNLSYISNIHKGLLDGTIK